MTMISHSEKYINSQKLIFKAIYSLFGSHEKAIKAANRNNMDFCDFEQIGAETLWKGCLQFKEDGGATFAHYIIDRVQKQILTEIFRRGKLIRIPQKKQREISIEYESLDKDVFEEKNIYEYISIGTNTEKTVIRKITFEEKMNLLKPIQREVIISKLNGMTDKEIAEKINKTTKAVESQFNRALKTIDPNYERQKRNLFNEFSELYEKGLSQQEIINELKINPKAYRNYKWKYNKKKGA